MELSSVENQVSYMVWYYGLKLFSIVSALFNKSKVSFEIVFIHLNFQGSNFKFASFKEDKGRKLYIFKTNLGEQRGTILFYPNHSNRVRSIWNSNFSAQVKLYWNTSMLVHLWLLLGDFDEWAEVFGCLVSQILASIEGDHFSFFLYSL